MGGNNANLLKDIKESKNKLTLSSQNITQAHAAFTLQSEDLLALLEQVENKFKELETREEAVEKRENEMRDKAQRLQERERKCTDREQKIQQRENIVSAKEAQWNETEKKMQQNASKIPNLVQMNVGGTRYTVSKEKLLQHKGSLFEEMIASNHSQSTSAGEIFIERDPSYFKYVHRFLVYGSFEGVSKSTKRAIIIREFMHFKLPCDLASSLFISRAGEMIELLAEAKHCIKILEWIPGKTFHLLYKGTLDGFAANDFHRMCDNKGPTLVMIQSKNGYLFGGYTPVSWDSTPGDKNSTDAFIFTLTNPHNIPPTKYLRNQTIKSAIYCSPFTSIIFGADAGCDILVRTNGHQNNKSFTNFPYAYLDTTGKDNITFTGEYNFTVNEIEVFSVI